MPATSIGESGVTGSRVSAPPLPAPATLGPSSPTVLRLLVTAMVLLAAAIGLCWQALVNAGQPTRAVAWGGAGITAYALSLLCLVGRDHGRSLGLSRWRLGSWSLLWYGASLGLATLTWAQPQTGTAAMISISNVLRALWLVAVGMTAWAIGYSAGHVRAASHTGATAMAALGHRFSSKVRSPLAPWILYAVGAAARVAFAFTTGTFGYVGDIQSSVTTASSYQQVLNILGSCAPLAVAAAALQVYRERVPGARVTLTILFLAEIAFSAVSGYKLGFIVTILAVAVPFTVARRRLHRGLLIFSVLVILLIVIPFNNAYRSAARSTSGTLSTSQAVRAAPGILAQTVINENIAGTLSSSASYLLVRIRNIDAPAIIMQRTPGQIGYTSPAGLIEEPIVSLIPRAIWPGKPIIDSGYKFSQEYYGVPAAVITSSAITPLGDLYRHGGWIPVIVGMFLLGFGTRFLDDFMNVTNPHMIFLFILLFPIFVNQEDDWAGMVVAFPSLALVWILAVYLTFRKNERFHPDSALGLARPAQRPGS
jgi:hypothetical protein